MVDVLTSPSWKCIIYCAITVIPRESILTSLVLVHAGYLFCNWHSLNTNYYGTTFGGMPRSFHSSQINACIVGIGVLGPRFIISSEGLGLHKMLPPRGFGTSPMPGKRCTTRLQLQLFYYSWHREHTPLCNHCHIKMINFPKPRKIK